MRTTSAATRAQRHTNNGKTRWNATYRQSYQMSPQQSTAKTSCALTHGPTPSLTERVFITLFPTQYYTRHRLGSSTRHLWSMLTTNIGSFSATSYAFHCKTTNASGNSMSRTTLASMWATKTALKAAPLYTCHTITNSLPGETATAS